MVNLFSPETAPPSTDTPGQTLLRLMGLDHDASAPELDELAGLATVLCGRPMATIVLLDTAQCYTLAAVGIEAASTQTLELLYRATALQNGVTVVDDTQTDPRFKHTTVLPAGDDIRSYAGVPLAGLDGMRVGVLCVMDAVPSTLTAQQVYALEMLGRQVNARLQLRERAALADTVAAERALEKATFNTILNSLPVQVYLKDSAGKIRFYNKKLAERYKISPDEWLGKTSHDLWDKRTADKIVDEDTYVLQSGQPYEGFLEVPEADGTMGYWRSMKVPCLLPDGGQLLACCSVDITVHMERERKLQAMQDELREANRKLNALALTDALTGLWNRRAFDARLGINMIAAQRNKLPMALIMLDIDDFKSINDSFGHQYGDEVLRQVAEILNKAKRAEDIACRFGGEEFSILLPGTGVEGAQSLGRRILHAMRGFVWEQGGPVTMSLGISICSAVDSSSCSAEALVNNADSALYRAKHEGKNRMMVHDG